MGLSLVITKRTDDRLLSLMKIHYSQPKGFVGRNICYAILYDNIYYGHIIGGSAAKHLPNRNQFLNITQYELNNVINNIFFHAEKQNGKYPIRNFLTTIIKIWEKEITKDWLKKYGDIVAGFETLVELPRTGECYRRAKWTKIGKTKGFTCKRVGGTSTDSWSGKRIWNTTDLRPKWVYCKKCSYYIPTMPPKDCQWCKML